MMSFGAPGVMLGISNMPYNPAKLALDVFPDEKTWQRHRVRGGFALTGILYCAEHRCEPLKNWVLIHRDACGHGHSLGPKLIKICTKLYFYADLRSQVLSGERTDGSNDFATPYKKTFEQLEWLAGTNRIGS
jgi:hypothetical protein